MSIRNGEAVAARRKGVISFLGHYIVLLVSLVVLFLIYPIMEECNLPARIWFLNAFFFFVLLSAIAVASRTRRTLWTVVVLAVPTVVIDWASPLASSRWVFVLNDLFSITFFTVVCVVIMRHVMTSKTVTGDTIAGSICAYLLLGLVWALLYDLIELVIPGSFGFPSDLVTGGEPGREIGFLSFAYFSFTTMTTLGYGDITPLSKTAQAFAPLQAVFGQLYIAILVARLVAMRVANGQAGPDSN